MSKKEAAKAVKHAPQSTCNKCGRPWRGFANEGDVHCPHCGRSIPAVAEEDSRDAVRAEALENDD